MQMTPKTVFRSLGLRPEASQGPRIAGLNECGVGPWGRAVAEAYIGLVLATPRSSVPIDLQGSTGLPRNKGGQS